MFAALGTVEPPIVEREQTSYLERAQSWFEARLPLLEDRIHIRLIELATHLGDADGWMAASAPPIS